MKRFVSLLLIAAFATVPVVASAATWNVDQTHSSVVFKVRHLFSNVQGEFTDFSGTIDYDPENPTAMVWDATVQVASISTNNEKRDGHLKSDDFFNAEKFPTITFKTTKVEKKDGKLRMTGDFTMRDVTKPVTLDVEFLGAGKHPMREGAQVAGFTATGKVNRDDFGVSWNSVVEGSSVVGDEVTLNIEIEAILPPENAE